MLDKEIKPCERRIDLTGRPDCNPTRWLGLQKSIFQRNTNQRIEITGEDGQIGKELHQANQPPYVSFPTALVTSLKNP